VAKLSVELQRFFFEEESPEQVTLNDLLSLAGERIFGFLFVLLSLPSALPIPAPGYSIPFGIVIFLLAMQLIVGRERPWLPKKWVERPRPIERFRGVVKAGIPWLRRIENITRPRLTYICTSLPGRVILGSAIALMALSMMIPIPGTNTLPAIGIFVTAFGLLEDDGAISLAGLTICLLFAGVIAIALITGVNFLEQLKDYIKGR